ncbi:MAG TPA: hypothetical protein H9881_14665 [Candidatus Stackebrandtia excrementipullorum]|nr:hypothetical protein [Candidatus Stackebrandtia excrementipullorum]
MISTIVTVTGMVTAADVRAVTAQVSLVEGVGAVAAELEPTGTSRLILKHKDDSELSATAVAAALEKAGDYSISPNGWTTTA